MEEEGRMRRKGRRSREEGEKEEGRRSKVEGGVEEEGGEK